MVLNFDRINETYLEIIRKNSQLVGDIFDTAFATLTTAEEGIIGYENTNTVVVFNNRLAIVYCVYIDKSTNNDNDRIVVVEFNYVDNHEYDAEDISAFPLQSQYIIIKKMLELAKKDKK